MGGSRSHSDFFLENHPQIALNQYSYFGVVYHVYSVCTVEPRFYDHPQNQIGVVVKEGWSSTRGLTIL